MESIIVDTSSILFALSNKVDVFEKISEQLQLKPMVSKGVVRELSAMSSAKAATRKYAKVAIGLIALHSVKIDPDNTYVDSWILRAAKSAGAVCTNDTKLRGALRAKGINVYAISVSGQLR